MSAGKPASIQCARGLAPRLEIDKKEKTVDISQESIKILIALLPGFLFIKVVGLRCSLKNYEVHNYIVDSLIVSLVIYAIATFFEISISGADWKAIFLIFTLTIVLALLWSVVINRDWIAKLLHPGEIHLSTHSSIFPVKAIEKFKGKWHLVRYSDGKEIVGIIREFNHETLEILIEKGRLVMKEGTLSPESAWYYSPSGDHIVYMRTLEEKQP